VTDIPGTLDAARVINAAGTVTRYGASPMDPRVVDAMATAARWSVDMAVLHARASAVIAAATGAQSGIVTSGAMAGLLVGAAACMTGLDPAKMAALPDTSGMRNQFIVSRSHRNSYDRALRAAGAELVEVGLPDRITGCGVRDAEAWEYESLIGERTAGILYLARADGRPDLADVVRVAQAARLPVLVDAAAELPPAGNLRRFIDQGADLVAFSGGKAIGGPSASGILCGRRALIGAALLQQLDLDFVYEEWDPPAELIDKRALRGVPRHGIGRACKVGKEQIVGLVVALQLFMEEGDAVRNTRWARIVDGVVAATRALPGLAVRRVDDAAHGGCPLVELSTARSSTAPSARSAPSARELAARLRNARPAIHVDDTNADLGTLVLAPHCLSLEDVPIIAAGLRAAWTG
jgi:L-seryl-tRNA(Ser) seleniumtransferase